MNARRYEELGSSAFTDDARAGNVRRDEPVDMTAIAADVLAHVGLDEGGAEYAVLAPEDAEDAREAVLVGYEAAWREWKASLAE